MAVTTYPVNHPAVVKTWSKRIAREGLKETMAYKFMGTSSNSMIQVFDEVSKGAGDKVTVPLRMQLTGRGVTEGEALEGNEEALSVYTDSLFINEMRHAARVRGIIDAQRIPWSAREEAALGIKDWYSDRIDTQLANQLCGVSTEVDTIYTGFNSATAPSTGTGRDRRHIIYQQDDNGSHSAESSLSTSDTFSLRILDRCVQIAKTASPLIRPIKVGSSSYYVCFIHPDQVKDLRTNTNTGDWLDLQKTAMSGGDIMDNPIFTGALGVYNGVVLHEWTRLPAITTGQGAETGRRAVFCGAQAVAMAWGKGYSEEPKYREEMFDYDAEMGVAVETILGAKKMVFNSKDFATIAISTYAPAP